ncbi:MAG: hypothetical protein ACT6RU_14530 [Aliihoeflea sp.]|uniref:hypothetical protein n=1 Tax=Aliihoeflea sp. TaxID=2608088 RepID=UPI004033E41D
MWTGTRRTARIFATEIRLVMVRDPRPIICGFAAIAMSCVLWSGGLPSPVAPATAAPSPVAGAYPDIGLQMADQLRRLWQLVDASTGRIALLETRMARFEARSNAIASNAADEPTPATSVSPPVPIVSAGALPPPTPIGAAVSVVVPPPSPSQTMSMVSFAQPTAPVQTAAAAPSPIAVTVAALAPPAASTPRNLVPPTDSPSVFAPVPAPTSQAPATMAKPIGAQPIISTRQPAPDAGKAPSTGARQVLRAVAGNRAWISKGPEGELRQIAVGDTIPGYGRVKSIQMRGDGYVVACDRGEIVG